MPTALLFPLLLRSIGPLAFMGSAIVAGIMNRSFMLVPLLALAATATTIIIRKFTPSPAMDLKAMLSPEATPEPPSIFRGMGQRFGLGLVGYAILFGLSALIAALFRVTDFEPQIRAGDLGFLLIPAVVAIIGTWVSARIGVNQMAGMMDQMQDMFAQMQAQQREPAGEEDAFTVEGEVIDTDNRES